MTNSSTCKQQLYWTRSSHGAGLDKISLHDRGGMSRGGKRREENSVIL